jgi:polar amino acid transport system substrate-binding protein
MRRCVVVGRLTCLGAALLGGASGAAAAGAGEEARAAAPPAPAVRVLPAALRWAGDAEGGAPYQFRDAQRPDLVVGFEVDLVHALGEILSRLAGREVRMEFVQYEWISLQQGLDKGDFDFIASGFEIVPDREARYWFSRPYYIYSQQLVVRKEENEIARLEDCRGRRVGTMSGTAAEKVLKAAGLTPRSYDGQVEPFRELELGRLDAVLLDLPIAVYYAGKNPNLKFVGERFEHGAYGLALRKNDAALADALDEALGELIRSGKLAAIQRRWGLWNTDQARLARGPNRLAELVGLGFSADGSPLPDEADGDAAPTLDVVGSSAEAWTPGKYGPLLIQAAGMTVFLSVASMGVAILIGLCVAVLRLYGPAPLRWTALVYVEFFRGTPLLLLLTFLYYGLPALGVPLHAVTAAILGFGLNYAAYEAEIYRSAILGVPAGQWEAGRALGLSDAATFRSIIFPQAGRIALGPITNDFVAMFKDTSLVSVIAVRELTKEYQILARSSLKFVELGLVTAALYLAMSVPLGYLSRRLEKRWGRGIV